ncbi:TIGR04283 family arsenosugar biosynthesis glycosyltransferase [Nonlabens sp.]|uniref:TIGR04283 family arsenosugar biosynthesis glycosyltransferase n=1 Tax=Nonlabens sp. TaxID=1888209 RepID=UPI0025F123EF|nr:TIGR04283 family arsenosugar biosynthesis glycosyltransferase [Nonlabens sp.]
MTSIIIPVLNEEASILKLLLHLKEYAQNASSLEVILVDGGSTDGTVPLVTDFALAINKPIVKIYSSEKGRGKQLQHGTTVATGELLYFLHADSYPPRNYDAHIAKAVKEGNPAGCFRMKFESWHPWLIIIGWFTRFSWKACRGGDQSQYITRDLYNEIGGYNTQIPIYEDYDLITRLYERGHYHVIPKWLKTSARRYHKKGVFCLQWFYIMIYWKKYKGASIDEIYQYYLSKCS